MVNVIEIANATICRGITPVFQNLSLKIALGENTALLGPNGAGKSTLLKLITREIYQAAGEGGRVEIFGSEDWNLWDLRSKLGIVSHDLQTEYLAEATGFNVILSGRYSSINVWSHQEFSSQDRSRAGEILDMLGVEELRDRPFGAMSTGQQRRLLLGRALINDPAALILDEPTSGLDLHACFQYLEIIRKLMQAGKTVILVTHHIHEIPPEVNRVVLIKKGRVVADGNKADILTSENLSSLFDTGVELLQHNGFYQAVPGS